MADTMVRKTILEMLEQRGYDDIEEEDQRIFANQRKVCAFTTIIQNLNIDEIRKYTAILEDEEIPNGILIFKKTTPIVKSIINNIPNTGITIETFDQVDLQFNITKHVLVPQHILLNKEDSDSIKKKYGVNFPFLLKTDAVSKFYNFPKGHIVKIIRKGGYITYRLVK